MTRLLSSKYVLDPSMRRSAICAVIILFTAATLTESWTYSLCLASCSATRSSQSMMNRYSRSRWRDDAGNGSCSLNNWFWSVPSVQLLPRSEARSLECLQHSTNKRANFACGCGDQAWCQRTAVCWHVPIHCSATKLNGCCVFDTVDDSFAKDLSQCRCDRIGRRSINLC